MQSFNEYYPEMKQFTQSDHDWIINTFTFSSSLPADFSGDEERLFIDLKCNRDLKDQFSQQELIIFWINRRAQYLTLSYVFNDFFNYLSYTCERTFSSLLYIKNKYRNSSKSRKRFTLKRNKNKTKYRRNM